MLALHVATKYFIMCVIYIDKSVPNMVTRKKHTSEDDIIYARVNKRLGQGLSGKSRAGLRNEVKVRTTLLASAR